MLLLASLVAYFSKKNYSQRQNILKIWGYERGLSYLSQLVFIWVLLKLELDWEQAARRNIEYSFKNSDRTLHRTLDSSVRSVHQRWIEARRSDQMLKQRSSCVWCEGIPASGQSKKTFSGPTRLWLRSVKGNRTCSVMTCEDLDLSIVNQTLGGSVRSLPPEHPVSRSRLDLGLYSVSFLNPSRGATI